MINELTPLHKTRPGRELVEEYWAKGFEQGRREIRATVIRNMASSGRELDEIADLTDLSVEEVEHFLRMAADR